jgi:hypothetical protein
MLLCFLAVLLGCCIQHASGFYNPSEGRWLSRDSINEKGGIHLYQFVGNRPNIQFDPDGRITFTLEGSGWKGECGAYSVTWSFGLGDITLLGTEGYFVQKVTSTRCNNPCPRLNRSGRFCTPRTEVYWEAWHTLWTHRDTFTDSFAYIFSGADPNGSWSYKQKAGDMKFFPISVTGDLLSLWGPFEEAGGLPGTRTAPLWWNDDPLESGNHDVYARWNCCCGRQYELTISPPGTTR